MPIQTINIGSGANDGTGDTSRDAMNKVNANFALMPVIDTLPGISNSTGLSVSNATAAGLQCSGGGSAATVLATSAGLVFGVDGGAGSTQVARFDKATRAFLPASDNALPIGGGSYRWSVIYAGTGTINTSDAREKTPVIPLTDAEIAAAKDLAKEIGSYQFLSSVAAKGASARQHIGMTVQRAIEVMQSHGLDPMRYGFICHDEWDATEEQPAGDRYAFRPDELLFFIARGLEARLAALEAT